MTREIRIGMALVAALGAFVFFMLVVGSLGGTRPDVDPLTVDEVADRTGFGSPVMAAITSPRRSRSAVRVWSSRTTSNTTRWRVCTAASASVSISSAWTRWW